ncbi:MAG: D-alanine--D-alanine ligase, partial [Actinomycetia bacterium]|nr:D-alanine--D-alanine ligase [Actinomycetes bacterium]
MKEKIAVLMGGRSLERDVSLKSGQRVAEALKEKGYEVKKLDVDENLIPTLDKDRPDLVYIALHGKYGEDGTIQEMLEILNIPYTGPGVYSSIVGFNKVLSKEIFKIEGILSPPFYALSESSFKEMGASELLPDIAEKIGLPLIVKPSAQGSALGIKIAHTSEELPRAIIGALSYDKKVLIEKFIKGKEISISILGDEVLPVVEIIPTKEYFDFESMYTMGKTDYFIPARIDKDLENKVIGIAKKVHKALKCENLSRTDMIIEEGTNQPYVLE